MARARDSAKNDAVKVEFWRERFARFDASGMKTAQFCAAEGVSTANFYAWRRKLGLTEPRANKSTGRSPFQQVLVNAAPAFTVRLPGEIRIEAAGASETTIRTIVSELVIVSVKAAGESEARSC